MRCAAAALLALLSLMADTAIAQVTRMQLAYSTYAAGVEAMQMQAVFGMGPWNYRINIDYHTTGLVGLLYSGRQTHAVRGTWQGDRAQPIEFFGEGVWRSQQRRTLIGYDRGLPQIKDLRPPQQAERQPVPLELQRNTMDTLSALAQLMRRVERGGSCETQVRTYDGRRLLEVAARTGGRETLQPTSRSIFSGSALRCDFEGRELAGFLYGEDNPEHRAPLHGSAWLAPMAAGAPPLPVRIAFQTRWLGPATMYLTGATENPQQAETQDDAPNADAFPRIPQN
jgi:hypothetical protein